MAAYVAGVDARCPLCGCSILSIGRGGHVMTEDLHPIGRGILGKGSAWGVTEVTASQTVTATWGLTARASVATLGYRLTRGRAAR